MIKASGDKKRASIVKLLIERGADVYATNNNGGTARRAACLNSNSKVYEMLLHPYKYSNRR